MTDDLKERLSAEILSDYGPDRPDPLCEEALARITELEARLAAAEAENTRLKRQVETLKTGWGIADRDRIKAEAGEDALAELLRPLADENPLPTCNCLGCRVAATLAAYEARRG